MAFEVTAVGLAALLGAVVTALAWWTDSRRKNKTEPVEAITQGALTLASALETVIGPLRDEVMWLRAEVVALRRSNTRLVHELRKHGIPVDEADIRSVVDT